MSDSLHWILCSVQFSSVVQSCLTLWDPMDCSTPGLSVHYQLPEFTQTHVHWVSDAIQPSHPLSSPSPPTFSLSQHQSVSSVAQSCLTLCDPMDCSTPGLSVHDKFLEFTQTHVQCVCGAIQPPHPLFSPSPPAFNLSQHQGLFKWVSSSHQVAKVLEFQHQSFQWIFRTEII